MEEYSVVKVVQLTAASRPFDGSEGVKRPPRVGDIGTIVHVNAPGKSYIVESLDGDGHTVWLAGFEHDELASLSETGQAYVEL